MSDRPHLPRTPSVPLYMSRDSSVRSHGSQNLSSNPVDHRSQAFRPFQRSSSGNSAQHSCGTPHLSLHGFGHHLHGVWHVPRGLCPNHSVAVAPALTITALGLDVARWGRQATPIIGAIDREKLSLPQLCQRAPRELIQHRCDPTAPPPRHAPSLRRGSAHAC